MIIDYRVLIIVTAREKRPQGRSIMSICKLRIQSKREKVKDEAERAGLISASLAVTCAPVCNMVAASRAVTIIQTICDGLAAI